MKVVTKMEGLEGVLATLKSLPPELVSKGGGPVRRAVGRAATLLRNEARKNFQNSTSTPGKTGKNYATGFTLSRIAAIRGKRMPGGMKGEVYFVFVKRDNHPAKKIVERARLDKRSKSGRMTKDKYIKARDIAYYMEYGSAKQEAKPWLRPALETKKFESMNVMRDYLLKDLDRIVKKLARQNKGR